MLTLSLPSELSYGVIDDANIGEIFVVGVDGVACAMPEEFLDVDELFTVLLDCYADEEC